MEELEKLLGTEDVNLIIRAMMYEDSFDCGNDVCQKVTALTKLIERLLNLSPKTYSYRDLATELVSILKT